MKIAVYCGSTSGKYEAYARGAEMLGKWIGLQGHTLVYGGAGEGLMGIVADAVLEKGGKVIGVLPDVASIQARRHPGITQYIDTKDMAERKQVMLDLADAYVALPGGVGTLDELSDVLSLGRLGIHNKPLVLIDIDGYYRHLEQFLQEIVASGFASEEDFQRVLISDDMEKITSFLGKTKE